MLDGKLLESRDYSFVTSDSQSLTQQVLIHSAQTVFICLSGAHWKDCALNKGCDSNLGHFSYM